MTSSIFVALAVFAATFFAGTVLVAALATDFTAALETVFAAVLGADLADFADF
ncbi:hypothetical protein [Diaphorobacter sp.]|uniref:hypothetical protein n=1 Tax=Diaphorobacter sp. TaxID=1934310 RepID=UPI0028A7C293|nr:hypothetical protein [Diaphorobacter sp.]